MLEVRDTGVGISAAKLSSPHSLGIIGMRERAEGLGAQLVIASEGGRGTVLTLRVGIAERALASRAAG